MLLNPYYRNGIKLKGSFHIHTTDSSCGSVPQKDVLRLYNDYDFLALTNHNKVSDLTSECPDKHYFNGIEVGIGPSLSHMVLVNPPQDIEEYYPEILTLDTYQNLSNLCIHNGGISILAHPNRVSYQHWQMENMMNMKNYTGIEVITVDRGRIEEDVAFTTWDQLLSNGKRVWGFGGDDFHNLGQEMRAWNVVLAKENTAESVLQSIKQGSFYMSTGFDFAGIYTNGNTVRFILEGNKILNGMYKYATLFGSKGRVLFEKTGIFNEIVYECKGDEGYIRAAVYVDGGRGAFSQPIFIA